MLKKLIHAITWRVKAWFLAASEILSDLIQNVIAGSMLCPRGLRIVLYRLAGNSVGKNCWLSPNCFLGPGGGRLKIGNNVFINYNNWFDLKDDILIDDGVSIAMNCQFVNGSHAIGPAEKRAGLGKQAPIVIGKGAWLGANTTVLMGVNIGAGTIVGAGSLVISDLEPNSIYVGRPAKLLRRIE